MALLEALDTLPVIIDKDNITRRHKKMETRSCVPIHRYGNKQNPLQMSAFDPKMTQYAWVIKTWSLTLKTVSYSCG